MDPWLTFLATIGADRFVVKTLVIICVLALLTVTGAAFTGQILTSGQGTEQAAN